MLKSKGGTGVFLFEGDLSKAAFEVGVAFLPALAAGVTILLRLLEVGLSLICGVFCPTMGF